MIEFRDKVAVVTGAGSGIGRGLAQHCAKEGMKIVLAGINLETLLPVQAELEAIGVETLVVKTDVSKASDVENLAQQTIDTFGEVHLLFNNAGVTTMGQIWKHTLADWEWMMGVNIWSIIHGIRYFVPIMLEQDSECYVVNNASFVGFAAGYTLGGIYMMTKHAVVSLSETLYYELKEIDANIHVSVLASGFVKSDVFNAKRNRPPDLQNDPTEDQDGPAFDQMRQRRLDAFAKAMPSDEFADIVFDALRENRFYVFSHPQVLPRIKRRFDNILEGRNPE